MFRIVFIDHQDLNHHTINHPVNKCCLLQRQKAHRIEHYAFITEWTTIVRLRAGIVRFTTLHNGKSAYKIHSLTQVSQARTRVTQRLQEVKQQLAKRQWRTWIYVAEDQAWRWDSALALGFGTGAGKTFSNTQRTPRFFPQLVVRFRAETHPLACQTRVVSWQRTWKPRSFVVLSHW